MVANTEEDEDSQDTINYKNQYKNLKRKLKFLIYENECFQEALRSTQRRLLKASRDRSFLLDRLLNYEKVEATSSEGEETESSDDGEVGRPDNKRRKLDMNSSSSYGPIVSGLPKAPSSAKKKKPPTPKPVTKSLSQPQLQMVLGSSGDGHMTPEEVERHLEARQPHYLDMDRAVATIPSEMFSNDPSLDIDRCQKLIASGHFHFPGEVTCWRHLEFRTGRPVVSTWGTRPTVDMSPTSCVTWRRRPATWVRIASVWT